jgi:hypothetical protein
MGFREFVRASDSGPLFYKAATKRQGKAHPSKITAARVGQWVRDLKVADLAVAPNYGWRHRFKTVAIELGLNLRVIDAIQAHAARTAGET